MTQPVLWELTSIVGDAEDGGWAAYERVVRFYIDTCHRSFIRDEYERRDLELRMRRPLRNEEVFFAVDPEATTRECLTEDWVSRRTADLQRVKGEERAAEAKKRVEAVEELERREPRWREMFSEQNFQKTVSKCVRREFRTQARKSGLRMSGAQWPQPRSAPTFWFSESFYVAKARRVFVENAAKQLTSATSLKDMPDLVDATHFRDAAYADVLVTRDRRLVEVGGSAGVSLRILSLRELFTELVT